MNIIILILISIISLLSLVLIRFLVEIRNINKQTKIKLNTDSNFIIVNDLKIKEVNEMTENLNLMFEKFFKAETKANHKEAEFKEMLSYIAHDVRTPMSSVQGYLQILQENSYSEENKKYYEIINNRLLNIKNLLEQFFFYSKLINNDYILETQDCVLYDVCCEAITGFYHQFQQKNIEPVIDFEDKSFRINANKDLMIRIFNNLIQNACIHGIGNIFIIQRENYISFSNEIESSSEIDVSKIFERFYKADSSRINISSGLGLTIVYELVHRINGNMEVIVNDNSFKIIVTFQN